MNSGEKDALDVVVMKTDKEDWDLDGVMSASEANMIDFSRTFTCFSDQVSASTHRGARWYC